MYESSRCHNCGAELTTGNSFSPESELCFGCEPSTASTDPGMLDSRERSHPLSYQGLMFLSTSALLGGLLIVGVILILGVILALLKN